MIDMNKHYAKFFDAINYGGRKKAAADNYLATVSLAVQAYPANTHCIHVDPVLWVEFSEWHKLSTGFRNREHLTREEVLEHFDYWEDYYAMAID